MEDFERKLTETDCYLQLLIDQNQSLVTQLEEEEVQECQGVVDRVTDMVETVKHAIVLLQIAKNASCPLEGEGVAPLVHRSSSSLAPSDLENGSMRSAEEGGEEVLETSSMGGSKGSPSPTLLRAAAHRQLSQTLKNPATIPAVSYSSSDDDEDDFYDAQDDVASRQGGTSVTSEPPTLAEEGEVSPLTPSEVDWDALYDNSEDTEDALDMKNNGSVITHLLSQVRIGMDLTKIVLPTFILERRSLLEMYADFFVHPTIFTDIATKPTAEERMVQVRGRW